MVSLPHPLLGRLAPSEAAALERAVAGIGEELAAVYVANVDDHKESRGDNAQLFGMKVWVHGDFRITGRFEDDAEITVPHVNGSYGVKVGDLLIGVYKLGDTADEDVHACFPDTSPTKRAYAERNTDQLALFELEPDSPLPPTARYALDDMIVAHFGNPREGLVKWYVGAPTTNERGSRRWAWIAKQDLPGVATEAQPTRPPMVPFDARSTDEIEVRPRPGRQAS
jgi:hypothetical protein